MPSLARQNMLVVIEIFVKRWIDEVIAALPARWQQHFGANRWMVLESCSKAELQSTRPLALSLTPGEVLVRRIELPLVSRFQLPALMRFEAPRHVPLPLDQVKLDFRIVRRDLKASRMLVELAIVRAEAIAAAERRADADGVTADAVAISTVYGLWLARRPFSRKWQQAWFDRRHQKLFFRVAIPVALIVALVLAVQNWTARLALSRDHNVAAARAEAVGIEPLHEQLVALDNKLALLASIRNRPPAAAVAEEVARLLPDDAWLQELDIEDKTVRLVGTARHATDLIRIFSKSRLFSNVEFEAPLTPANEPDDDLFDIVMTRT